MIVYLVMLAVSVFFAVYAQNTKRYPMLDGSYRVLRACSALPFIAVSVCRFEVGIDWNYVYSPYYYYINHGIAQFKEVGFNYINKFLYLFTEDSWILFAFVGLITNVLFMAAIYQQSEDIPFSILLYFLMSYYFASLNQIRQMLAMAVFVYALKYVYARKWKAYMGMILLAISIHFSSIIYLPVYFLYGKEKTSGQMLAVLAGCIAGLPVIKVILVGAVSFTSYGWYLSSAFAQNNFYLLGFLVSFFYLLLHILHLKQNELTKTKDAVFSFMSDLTLFSTIVLLLSAVIPQISRVADGLSVIQIFSVPRMISREKNRNMRGLYILSFLIVCTGKFLYDTFINQWHGVLPYQTIFQR